MKIFKKFLAFTFLILLTTLTARAQDPTTTLEFKNAAASLEIVQQYVNGLKSGDVSKMDAALASNVMVYGLGGGLDSLTKAQHKDYFTNSTSTYKHSIDGELYLPVKVTNNWNEGEWVLAWGTNTLTNKSTGKTTIVPYHSASRLENGKITYMRYWYDMLNVMESQGYKITPPAN